jgi:ketosteroid isomerase-like protein
MSQENVEIVRRVTDHFTETHEVVSELVAPDFVWDLSSWPAWSGQQEFHGLDGFVAFFAEWIEPYSEWDQEVEGVIDAGGSQVVETTRQRGRLQGSASWLEWRYAIVYTIEEGLIRRGKLYATPEEALEAAGMQE